MSGTPVRALVAVLLLLTLEDAARCVPDEPATFAARRTAADDAVKAGLDWLLRHQAPDGSWSLCEFGKRCAGARCGGVGIDCAGGVAPTALALSAFLGAGETPTAGDRREALAAAVKYVLASQDADGCFGPRALDAFLVGHAAATGAIAETYWATRDPALLAPLTKARDFLLKAQNMDSGWRYATTPPGDDDSFMTTNASLALREVELAGLPVPRASRDGALAWFDRVTHENGRCGYATRGGFDARIEKLLRDESAESSRIRGFRTAAALLGDGGKIVNIPAATIARWPVDRCSTMTAGAALVRALTGGDPGAVAAAAKVVLAAPPRPSARFLDLHYAYFGSLLLAQTGGGADWREAAVESLTALQHPATDGCLAGSFDPTADPWGAIGGRVYSTALATLALEAPSRFPRVFDPRTPRKR